MRFILLRPQLDATRFSTNRIGYQRCGGWEAFDEDIETGKEKGNKRRERNGERKGGMKR